MELESKTPATEPPTAYPSPSANDRAAIPRTSNKPMRLLFLTLGIFFTLLGIIGIFVPLLPTTIWLIIAAGFFARSDERLESWLLNHPRFGATIRGWRHEGSIAMKHKIVALATLWPSIFISSFFIPWYAAAAAIACAAGVTVYVLSRPAPGTKKENSQG